MTYKWSVNLFTNPYPIYSHTYTWQYILHCSQDLYYFMTKMFFFLPLLEIPLPMIKLTSSTSPCSPPSCIISTDELWMFGLLQLFVGTWQNTVSVKVCTFYVITNWNFSVSTFLNQLFEGEKGWKFLIEYKYKIRTYLQKTCSFWRLHNWTLSGPI
jgi:hypothetical protein